MEAERLSEVLSMIAETLRKEVGFSQEINQEMRSTIKSYWENVYADTVDEAQTAEAVERQRQIGSFVTQKLNRLHRLLISPYFGRIDFRETTKDGWTEPEPIYIGIANFIHPRTGEPMIFDWRAPIAGMYYDYELGPAEYESPRGQVAGEILLKRHFKIEDGRFVYIFDCGLKIDDEILQAIMTGRAGDKMRNVVASIQREQNKAIRDENHRLLVVEGPAGSGKTSVALHRIAYLLYKEREQITARNILIFSPNPIFSSYISNVLPELGEENMLQTTFQDYVQLFRERYASMTIEMWHEQVEYLLSPSSDNEYKTRTHSIQFKSSELFRTILHRYLAWLEERLAHGKEDIVYRDQTILSRMEWQELFSVGLAYAPIQKRLQQIRRIIYERMRPLERERAKEIEVELANNGEHVNEKEIRALSRLAVRDELASFKAEIDARTEVEPVALYLDLFREENRIRQFADKSSVPEDWPAMAKQTVLGFGRGTIPYEDLLPLLVFSGELEGFRESSTIRHLIIDEAQDYSMMQFELLHQLFPKSLWTVVGDYHQSVHPYLYTADFEKIADMLKVDDAKVIRLHRSYRSTKEIFDFASALLPEGDAVQPLERSGDKPKVCIFAENDELFKRLHEDIRKLQSEGCGSIAIIGKTQADCERIYNELLAKVELHLVKPEDETFKKGIMVIPVYLAKGLEFDGVIIPYADCASYHQEYDRKLLYTACTRALRFLNLYCTGEISPFIKGIESNLYDGSEC